jgi:carboxyl-terminal processing protease
VEPDIGFPGPDDGDDHGERSLDNALPWTQIAPAQYRRVGLTNLERLNRQSTQRRAKDSGFAMLDQRNKMMADVAAQTRISLRESDRRSEDKQRESAFDDQRDAFLRSRGITPVDEDADRVDEDALDAQREAIARIQVEEAARVLADGILLEGESRPRAAMSN